MYYKETQRVPVWFMVLCGMSLFIVTCLEIYGYYFRIVNDIKETIDFHDTTFILLCWMSINLFMLVKYFYLDTLVDDKKIQVRYSILLGPSPPDIALEHIRGLRKVSYSPWRKVGYRLRHSFEGKSCEFCTIRGPQGVLIETNERRLLIGSQHPDQLIAALRDAGVNTESAVACAE